MPLDRRTLLAALLLAPAAAARAAGKSKGDQALDPYRRMEAVTTGVALRGGRRGVLTVEAGVETPEPGLRLKVEQSLPRLRAAWFQSLSRYASGLRPGALPDAGLIATLLQKETDRVLGAQGATFLIGSVLVH